MIYSDGMGELPCHEIMYLWILFSANFFLLSLSLKILTQGEMNRILIGTISSAHIFVVVVHHIFTQLEQCFYRHRNMERAHWPLFMFHIWVYGIVFIFAYTLLHASFCAVRRC